MSTSVLAFALICSKFSVDLLSRSFPELYTLIRLATKIGQEFLEFFTRP